MFSGLNLRMNHSRKTYETRRQWLQRRLRPYAMKKLMAKAWCARQILWPDRQMGILVETGATGFYLVTSRRVGSHPNQRNAFSPDQGVTVKTALLVASPPGVVRTTFPVLAPVGTMKVTCLSEDTVKTSTFTPPTVIVAAWMRPAPASVTASPTLPLGGVTLVM